MAKIGRNDPCPCGSGQKYKKCCMMTGQALSEQARALHRLDERVTKRLIRFAVQLDADWEEAVADEYFDDGRTPEDVGRSLMVPWGLYHYEPDVGDSRSAAEWLLDEEGPRLPADERAWIEAGRRAWLSVWEVLEVKPGVGLALRDLLTGAERFVYEESASRGLSPRLAILTRVVEHEGISVLVGTHPRPLPPREATAFVAECTDLLEVEGGSVRPVDLRDHEATLELVRLWHEMESEMLTRPAPRMTNFDGDPLEWVTDRFAFDPERRDEVIQALSGLGGADGALEDGGTTMIGYGKDDARGGRTSVGRALVGVSELALEANSVRRADSLRADVQAACGAWIRHVDRARLDVVEEVSRRRREEPAAEPVVKTPEMQQAIREYKEHHYAGWPNERLGALQGRTPREAVGTPEGRREVETMLKQIEYIESRHPEGERFDVSVLRKALGVV